MRFTTSVLVSILVITAQAAVANDESLAMTPREELVDRQDQVFSLGKRDCVKTGCRCDNHKKKQRTVCGACKNPDTKSYIITRKRYKNHIYECSADGTSCCDYGVAVDCGKKGQRCG
ncbi:mold-specific m46 protein [Colletotrichum kahawae]|uniref:Mold-specific m46 protein n=1 Tax=Colletotrichum kahawae TaxID=34407 RepID=A0AAD9YJZ7_COLKA|nr:mold-specific m46 protein [Colletotrichum kahawae]